MIYSLHKSIASGVHGRKKEIVGLKKKRGGGGGGEGWKREGERQTNRGRE